MKVTLTRRKHQPSKDCTLGVLSCPELGFSLPTIERPWIPSTTNSGGTKRKSCVPLGTYQLVRHDSPKHPKTWALVNLELDVLHFEGDDHDPDEDRATCVIHVANYAHQLEGCIAPGMHTTLTPNGEYMVGNSGKAMDVLRTRLPWTNDHSLEIVEA